MRLGIETPTTIMNRVINMNDKSTQLRWGRPQFQERSASVVTWYLAKQVVLVMRLPQDRAALVVEAQGTMVVDLLVDS